MAGNFASEKKLDIKWASMSLHWNNPTGIDFEPFLEQAKKAGYDGVTCFAFWGLECFLDDPKVLAQHLRNTGMELAAIDLPLDTKPEDYERVMDLMEETKCRQMVCIIRVKEKIYPPYADMINHIGEITRPRGIYAHLHNNTASIGENWNDWEHLIPLIDFDKVSLMLDVGHATKDFCELPYPDRAFDYLNKHWDKIHYMELKDYNKTTDLDTPLGEGYADFDRIFALMKDKGYTGWITIEQNQNNGLSLGRSPFECAQISREFVRKGLEI